MASDGYVGEELPSVPDRLTPLGDASAGQSEPPTKAPQIEEIREENREAVHFMEIAYSIADYKQGAISQIDYFWQRLWDVGSDPHDLALMGGAWNTEGLIMRMKQAVEHNQKQFLDMLVWNLRESIVGPPAGLGPLTPPPGHLFVPDCHVVNHNNASKTRSILKQFVRDWAPEGEEERNICYGPLLNALEEYLPISATGPWRRNGRLIQVLTPGSGLGRLTFEVAKRGYRCEGNEFSYHMLLGTMWVLNEVEQALDYLIYPFVLDTADRWRIDDHLRPVYIPDVAPNDYCYPESGFGEISMRGGEFVSCYEEQTATWDAILSAFFIDTANNIFIYIRTFAKILRPGGIWVNIGPLLWHYSSEGGGEDKNVSIELSWEEVKPAIEKYFEIKELARRSSVYNDGGCCAKKKLYNSLFFVAVRNDVPAGGRSNAI